MNKTLEMPTLYDRLLTIGFPEKFIQEKALPQWWNSELEQNPVAVMEAAGYISKRLSLDLASVLNPDVPIKFREVKNRKLKKRQNTNKQRLLIAQCLATRIAEMISYAAKSPFTVVPSDPSEIRSIILKNHDWVNLENLISFCWSCGIPVAHFSNFPSTHKMDGIAAYLNERPVIVISSGRRYSAYLVFILAHELGHIACGHVQDGLLVDESIKDEIQDKEEEEANNFAVNLLLGKEYNWEKMPDSVKLRRAVGKIGHEDRVDPGVLALNYAFKMSDFRTGNGALKIIERQANAPAKINKLLSDNLDWEELDKDSRQYLRMVTGM